MELKVSSKNEFSNEWQRYQFLDRINSDFIFRTNHVEVFLIVSASVIVSLIEMSAACQGDDSDYVIRINPPFSSGAKCLFLTCLCFRVCTSLLIKYLSLHSLVNGFFYHSLNRIQPTSLLHFDVIFAIRVFVCHWFPPSLSMDEWSRLMEFSIHNSLPESTLNNWSHNAPLRNKNWRTLLVRFNADPLCV